MTAEDLVRKLHRSQGELAALRGLSMVSLKKIAAELAEACGAANIQQLIAMMDNPTMSEDAQVKAEAGQGAEGAPKRRPGRPKKQAADVGTETAATAATAEGAPKRRPGRPKKQATDVGAEAVEAAESAPKRKGGRPRKQVAVDVAAEAAESAPKRKGGRPRKQVTADVAVEAAESAPKRKGGRPRKAEQAAAAAAVVEGVTEAAAPKRRGRPPKAEQAAATAAASVAVEGVTEAPPKRKGGRPRKVTPELAAPVAAALAVAPVVGHAVSELERGPARRGGRPRKVQPEAAEVKAEGKAASAVPVPGFTLYLGCKPTSGAVMLEDLVKPLMRAALEVDASATLDQLEQGVARWYGALALEAVRKGLIAEGGAVYCGINGNDFVAIEVLRAYAAQVVQG